MVRPATRTIAWLALGGSVALLVVAVGLASRRVGDDEVLVRAATTRAALLERWSTWRTMPVRFEEVTRREAAGTSTTATVTIVQRDRDRVVRDGESISAVIRGRLIGCSPPSGDRPPACVDNGPSDQLAALRTERQRIVDATTAGAGAPARYRLADLGGGCFRLREVEVVYRPEFGDRTDYCFDGRGLLVVETVVVNDLTITTTRRRLGSPRDQDFELPSPVSSSTTTSSTPRGKATGG